MEAHETRLYKAQLSVLQFAKRFDIGGPKGEVEDGKGEIEGLKKHVTKYFALLVFLIMSGLLYQVFTLRNIDPK